MPETDKNISELVAATQSRELEISLQAALDLAVVYNEKRDSLALEYASMALEKSIKSGNKGGVALAHLELASFFLYISLDYTSAIQHCQKSLQYADAVTLAIRARAHRLMGIAYYFLGRIGEAEEKYQEALAFLQKIDAPTAKNKEDLGNIYYNLAILNNTPENNFLRAYYLNLALEIFTAQGYMKGIALCSDGFAIYHFNEGDYDEAVKHHQRSLEIFESLNDESGISRSYNNMGQVYLKTGDYEKGFTFLKKALKIHRQRDEKYNLSVALINLGRTCLELGKEDQALQYLNEAFDVLKHSANDHLLCELYDIFRKIYESRGDFEKAYKYQSLWIVYNNALHADETKKSINQALTKITTEQKENTALFEKDRQAQIRNYIKRLEVLNHELEQFVHAAAHDLREPLRSIKSFAELLHRRLQDHEQDHIREYTDFITDSVGRMDRVIHDLLDYSTAASSSEEAVFTDIKQVIDQVRIDLKQLLDAKNGEIVLTRSGKLLAPPSQLLRLFENLIANGLKFNRSEKPVVKVSYSTEGDFHKIKFSDNGIGIEAKYYQKIFTIFQRLHKRNEFGGNGMGLTVCKKIVDKFHGRIEVQSTVGEGSVFTVYLPF